MAAGGTASYLLPVVTILIHILFPPFLFVLGITILLASFGKSLGIRKLYVRALIRIFDFARKIATEAQEQNQTRKHIQIIENEEDAVTKISDFKSKLDDKEQTNAKQSISEKSKELSNVHKNDTNSTNSENVADSNTTTCSINHEKSLDLSSDPIFPKDSTIKTPNGIQNNDEIHSEHPNDAENLSLKTSNDNSVIKNNDVAYLRQRLRGMGRESRHNVISRRDNLMLSPDQQPGAKNGIIKSVHEEVDEDQYNNVTQELISSEQNALLNPTIAGDSPQREFELDDVYPYIKTGIASIIEDEVTQRFVAEELKSWNLLTRTSQSFEFVNIRLTIIWIAGFIFRYCLLLPGRTLILFVGLIYLIIMTTFIGLLPWIKLRNILYKYAAKVSFRIMARAVSADVTFHNREFKAKNDGICVANHSTPWDAVMLSCDNTYALVAQLQGGLFGLVERALNRATAHIWFERSKASERAHVAQRLREHVEDPDKLPILIFPEGTCINNTSVMQFKKGSFEVGGTIYPVAIKYDPLFGDAFWNSSKHGMVTYIYLMMTSWAIVCDVWYLPPMTKKPDEDAITFANRVKAEIARQGGLVDLMWDGNLKRSQVKSEWKGKQQQAFAERIKIE